jgi:HPt (histidine-containing phosphotransfer) domain-containing protein
MDEDLIDQATLTELKQTVGDDFVLELIGAFLDEAPPMLADLRNAFATAEAEPLRRHAHSLKSNAQTFGALLLAAQARALERAGLGSDKSDLDALDKTYAETAAALRAFVDG